MKHLNTICILFFLITSCSAQSDGTYCADVDRYNTSTGKESSYRLTVEVEDKRVVQLNWPNGGYSDEDDFAPESLSNNKTSFRTYEGVNFRVRLLKKGTDCFDEVSKAVQCTSITKSGSRCKNKTDNKSGKCWVHKDN